MVTSIVGFIRTTHPTYELECLNREFISYIIIILLILEYDTMSNDILNILASYLIFDILTILFQMIHKYSINCLCLLILHRR